MNKIKIYSELASGLKDGHVTDYRQVKGAAHIEVVTVVPETTEEDDVLYLIAENDSMGFAIADVKYQAEEGMTWEQWINSEYCTIPDEHFNEIYVEDEGVFILNLNGSLNFLAMDNYYARVLGSDLIIRDYTYGVFTPKPNIGQ